MSKRISVLAVALVLGVGVAYGGAAPADTCIPHQGNHCKRLANEGGDSTTDAATTTSSTTPTTTTTSEACIPGTGNHCQRLGDGGSTTTTTASPVQASVPLDAAGTVSLTNKTWVCPGAVNLKSVSVTITSTSTATDAVKLANGCTGYIGHIDVVQYKGDGIHITNAHDLVIGSVTIRCYSHVDGKHQDGIQVLGGQRVTVNNADVGCYSANNSQVWINDGAGGNGPGGVPTDVVFVGGHFQGLYDNGEYGPGGAYGVSIGNSVRTGFRNATVCPNAHPARQLNIGSAVDPVNVGNNLPASC